MASNAGLDLAAYGRLRAQGVPHTEAIAAATVKAAPPAKRPPVLRAPTSRERVLGRLQDLVEGTLVPDLDTAAPVPPARPALLGGPSATMRAATPAERFNGRVMDLVGSLREGVGRITDPLGLTDFAGIEAAATNPEHIAMGMPDPPAARALTGLVKGATRGGFYSRVEDAVRLLPAKGAHPNKVTSLLKSNASAEELAHRKVPEFLASKGNAPVTPAQLQAHLAAHPAPVPKVVTRGGPRPEADALAEQWQASMDATNHAWQQWQEARTMGAAPEAVDAARARWQALNTETDRLSQGWETASPKAFETKYARYQLPGGENYRETLLTLPPEMKKQGRYKVEIRDPNGGVVYKGTDIGGTDVERLRQRYEPEYPVQFEEMETPDVGAFQVRHFDEPNIVVHTRANERTLPTGERGRFLEEVQSDWHQAGKQKGYGPELRVKAYYETPHGPVPIGYGKTEAAALADIDPKWKGLVDIKFETETLGHGVPDAPFKESWPDLGLKQQLLETAADPQASWLGFTSGATQAARYDLSKQIGRIEYLPKSGPRLGAVKAYDLDGNLVIDKLAEPTELPDIVGKEVADRLIAPESQAGRFEGRAYHALEGLDLQVGGAGMRHFYDQVLPKRLEKILKPFGGTVERGVISGDPSAPADVVARYADQPDHPFTKNQKIPMWFAKLTPEMKARILKEGLPLLTLPLAALLGPARAAGAEPTP